jgi:hypothetical protein
MELTCFSPDSYFIFRGFFFNLDLTNFSYFPIVRLGTYRQNWMCFQLMCMY